MKNILVPVDFSEITPAVIDGAASVANAFSAKLWLVHVAPPDPDFVGYDAGPQTLRDQQAEALRREHRELQDRAEGLRAGGVEATALMIQGPTVQKIREEAARLDADLIVMGRHGRGFVYRALLGSVSREVVRHATCPVMLVPASGEPSDDTDASAS